VILVQSRLLAQLAGTFPDGVAWKNMADGRALTVAQWDADANRLARGLRARGIGPKDRVALGITPHEPLEWLVSYMGIHRAGAIAVPLNTRLSRPELVRILRAAEVATLLASPGVLNPGADLPEMRQVVTDPGDTERAGGTESWTDWLDQDPSDLGHPIAADDVADIMYTSGTTGAPKGVVVRHGGLSSNDRVPEAWSGLGFTTSSPFSTTTGSLLICGPMRGGMSGWFLPRFEVGRWIEIVEKERPVLTFLVPALVQLLLADPRFAEADLSSVAIVSMGSAPIATESLRRLGAIMPNVEILIGYGMTEFGAATSMPMGDAGRHLGSVGEALPGVELRIVDEAGQPLPTGEVGQVVIRGARSLREYFNEPDESRRTWADGWLQSGDLGHLDPDGFLWIDGRMKETIIRGGNNIMPGEVEAAFAAHPEVVEVAVAPIPHPVLGEDVAAWVVLTLGSTATAPTLRAFLLERLADYKVPRRFSFVAALPRNEAGKVQKHLLVVDPTEGSVG
jgi:acyl-CoA synthetase (AMP-forming)/AMP-acid ligase II